MLPKIKTDLNDHRWMMSYDEDRFAWPGSKVSARTLFGLPTKLDNFFNIGPLVIPSLNPWPSDLSRCSFNCFRPDQDDAGGAFCRITCHATVTLHWTATVLTELLISIQLRQIDSGKKNANDRKASRCDLYCRLVGHCRRGSCQILQAIF